MAFAPGSRNATRSPFCTMAARSFASQLVSRMQPCDSVLLTFAISSISTISKERALKRYGLIATLRLTGRRCTRCGRPACPDCLVQASVGSQCFESLTYVDVKAPKIKKPDNDDDDLVAGSYYNVQWDIPEDMQVDRVTLLYWDMRPIGDLEVQRR